jgi:hypothetical protein
MIITYIILFILFKNIYSLYSIHQLYKITTLDDVIIYPKFNNINNNIKSLLTNCNKYEILYSNYNGRLFEISHNYKIYNYKPYAGSEYVFDSKQLEYNFYDKQLEYPINNCKGEFVYRTKNNLYKNELSDQIMIKINNNIILYISIINNNNIFVLNNFLLDTYNWTLTNNNNYILTHFQQQIIASDNLINLDLTKKYDKSLSYFTLIFNKNNPFFKYNLGICFKSYLIFTLNIFTYENNKIHSIHDIKFVKLQSINNIEIYYPLIDFDITKNTHTIKIKLSPELWFNSVDNSVLSDDEFIFVLSNLYKIEILGDLCVGFETVGLSNIMIKLD